MEDTCWEMHLLIKPYLALKHVQQDGVAKVILEYADIVEHSRHCGFAIGAAEQMIWCIL